MPETYGKRQRRDLRQRKIAAREERRVARSQRKDQRAAGLIPPDAEIAWPEPDEGTDVPGERDLA